jgi:hypothetical protein
LLAAAVEFPNKCRDADADADRLNVHRMAGQVRIIYRHRTTGDWLGADCEFQKPSFWFITFISVMLKNDGNHENVSSNWYWPSGLQRRERKQRQQ